MKKLLLSILLLLFFSIAYIQAQTNLINENFSSASGANPPSGWSTNQLYTTYSTDIFRYDNPGARSIYSPLSGTFAIFDSDNYSNNNAFENIALESPTFNANGIPNLSLSFDYQFGAQVAFGYVEVFDGSTWNLLGTITTPTGNVADSVTVDISSFCGNVCNAKIRFRWSSNSGGYWAIDNVKVSYKGNKDSLDASVFSIINPVSGSCANPTSQVEVLLKNNGTKSIGNYPVILEVFDGKNTVKLTDTSKIQLPACSTTKLKFNNTIDISDITKTYIFKAYTVYKGDQYTENDTLKITDFKVQTAPKQPIADTFLVCNNTNVKVNISPNVGDQTFWYSTNVGGSPFLKDNSFLTNTYNLTKDTVLYVETFRSKNDTIPKPYSLPSTAGYNAGNSTGYWITVTAKNDIVIDSFSLLFRDNFGTKGTCSLFYKLGTQNGFESSPNSWTSVGTTSVVSRGSNALAFMKLGGVKISSGQTITFYINSTMSMEFTQKSLNISNTSMEVSASSVHLGSAFSMSQILNNFSFPGTIFYSVPCLSDRVPIFLDFEKRPQSEFIASLLFQGTFSNNYPKIYDAAEVGDTLIYEITPPTGFNNSDYNTKWTIKTIEVSTKNGTLVSDTLTTFPTLTDPATIRFIATSNFRDSIIVIKYGLSIIGFCDTVIQRHISIAPKPVPSFSVSGPCVNFVTNFDNTSTIVTGTMSYQWDFGDGSFSNKENPSHAYLNKGTYQVKLIATSNLGFSDSVIQQVEIVDIPKADFNFKSACEGDTVHLSDNSLYNGKDVSYVWSFTDGSKPINDSTGIIGKVFLNAGIQKVTLRINVDGCYNDITKNVDYFEKAQAIFSLGAIVCDSLNIKFTNKSKEPSTGTVAYEWSFGDNKIAFTKDVTHQYDSVNSYMVTLYSTTNNNCIDSFKQRVDLLASAKIDIAFVGQECTNSGNYFTNNTKTPTGYSLSYIWDFGDGDNSSVANPTHNYKTAGQYIVHLDANVSNGCTSSKTITLNIKEKPVATYILNDNSLCEGVDSVSTINQSTYSGTGLSYTWVFDNQKYTTKDVKIKGTKTGVYYLKLIAEANSCKDSVSKTVIVNPIPVSTFTTATAQLGNGSFYITPDAPNGSGKYVWKFNDGSADASNTTNFLRQFQKEGNIEICLYRTDVNLCISNSCSTINVNTASVNTSAANNMMVYPNPAKNEITIENPNATDVSMTISIINALGGIVMQKNIQFTENTYQLSTADLAPGIYTLKLNDGSSEQTKKIIISK